MDGRRRRRVLAALGVLVVMAGAGAVAGVGVVGADSISTDTAPDCSTVEYTQNSSGWYEVTNVSQLQCIETNGLGQDYVLTNDIDASGTENWNSGNGFAPIGDSSNAFGGTFDGDGYTISDLYIGRGGTSYVGLFSAVNSGGTVTTVELENADVTGSGEVGSLAGDNAGTITDSRASGTVSGSSQFVGGVVGYATGDIRNTFTTVAVTSSSGYVGGLAGWSEGMVSESGGAGDVDGDGFQIGGLIGEAHSGTVTDSYATGDVSVGGDNAGGLIGWNYATITDSYAAGAVGNADNNGGLAGRNGGSISDSYWDEDSTGLSSSAGGGTSLSTSEMQGSSASSNMGNLDFSGTWETVENSEGDATGDGYPMLQSIDRQTQVESQDLNAYAGGDGSESDPYEIENWYHLDNVRDNLGAAFVLTADLDSNTAGYDDVANSTANSGNGFDPIGEDVDEFTGTFDGNDHTISGLTINRGGTYYVGLFGWVGSGGRIENVGVENVDITGFYYVGGLVGYTDASVTGSYATGDVDGDARVGGLVGSYSGSVDESYAAVTVIGTSQVGGLVGQNSGPLSESYATGAVNGDSDVGGLVGVNSDVDGGITSSYATGDVDGTDKVGGLVGRNSVGDVTKSYATGDVTGSTAVGGLVGENRATVTDSYWDKWTTNQGSAIGTTASGATSSNLQGLTTAEMQGQAATDNLSSFDFVGTWHATSGYPALAWENTDPFYGVSVDSTTSPVDAGETLDVTATITNWGADGGSQTVTLTDTDFSNSQQDSQSNVELDSGDSTDLTLSWETGTESGTGDVTVASDNESATENVEVEPYAGGDGSESNPYEIENWYHLDNVRDNLGSEFVLTADLDSNTEGYDDVASDTADSPNGFDPIGEDGTEFTGTFDGDGHMISDLYIDRGSSDYVGLFGYLGTGSSVVEVGLANATVTADGQAGTLAGGNDGTIERSFATGDINTSGAQSGGLVGLNEGDVLDTFSSVNVTSSFNYVGGLVGDQQGGTVTRSYAVGTVDGDSFVGGLVGRQGGGTITDAYWDIQRTEQETSAGDAIGLFTRDMVGADALDSANMSSLSVPPWETVTASTDGDGYPILQGLDSEPQILTPDASVSGAIFVDILDGGTIVLDFEASDTVLSVKQTLESRTGVEPDQRDLVFAGNVLDDSRTLSDYNVQKESTLSQVPLYAGGDGTETDPYEIETWVHLDNVRANLGANFTLISDLNSNTAGYDDVASATANSNDGFEPLGDSGTEFSGTFEGANKTISNLTIDRGSTGNVGLFGVAASGATIRETTLRDADVTGGQTDVGALVGKLEGTVTRSSVAGGTVTTEASGEIHLGGLVGSLGSNGKLELSNASATVDGSSQDEIGGIAGDSAGTIERVYFTGEVTNGGDKVGGILGDINSGAALEEAYVAGPVSGGTNVGGVIGNDNGATITGAYWDTDVTGQGSSAGGTGLTTAEMQRFAPQTNMAPLDYTSTWTLTSGYPRLDWEGVTAITVDSVDAADTTVDEDESGSITVTANEGGTNAGEGVTIEVTDDDGLDGFATGDTEVTDANGEVTFSFAEGTGGSYTPEFAWADDTSISDTATATVRDAPEVSSIARNSPTSPTNADTVEFDVTFTESVTGVDTSDFTVTQVSGDVSGSVTSVDSSSGTTIAVTVDSVTGDGDLRLDLIDDDSITSDSTDVSLGGDGKSGTANGSYSSGQTFTIDNVVPSLSGFSVSNPSKQDIAVAFDSDQPLRSISVTLDGPETVILVGNFDVNEVDGTYSYFTTYQASTDGTYTATLTTATDAAGNDGASGQSRNVTVDAEDPPFEPAIVETNSPVVEGDRLNLTLSVTNTGNEADDQTVSATVGAETQEWEIWLSSGQETTRKLAWETQAGDAGNYTAEVTTPNGTTQTEVRIDPVTLDSLSLGLGADTLDVGETTDATVTAAYSNGTTADVTDGADLSVGNTTVATIDNGTLTAEMAGETTVTATTDGEQATATLTVTEPAVPPTVQSAVVEDDRPQTVVLTFDRDVELTAGGPTTGFTVTADGDGITVDGGSADGQTVELVLSEQISPVEDLTVAYDGSDNLQSVAGVTADAFEQSVTNNVSGPTPGEIGVEKYELSTTSALVDHDTVSIEATVGNGLDEQATTTVPLVVNGTVVEEQEVTLGAGESTTVTFERTFSETGSVTVTVGDQDATTVDVFALTIGDGAGDSAPAQDLDGDGLREDVNGDGEFTLGDVHLLFEARDDSLVVEYGHLFDFDGDDAGVTLSDIQALFQTFQQSGD